MRIPPTAVGRFVHVRPTKNAQEIMRIPPTAVGRFVHVRPTKIAQEIMRVPPTAVGWFVHVQPSLLQTLFDTNSLVTRISICFERFVHRLGRT